MPRFVDRDKRPLSTSERRRRAGISRFFHRQWVDPYPTVMGTVPEKMVYAQLMFRGINFYYQSSVLVNLPLLKINKFYRPDFVLPDLKIIIEVQGVYFHSKPESMESDAYKQALYNMIGYEVLVWWDYEIEQNIVDLFIRHPKLKTLTGSGGRIITTNDKHIDDLKGLRTTNQRRFRPKSPVGRDMTKRKKRRKVISTYGFSR